MADKPLLEVKDLVIHYETDDGVVKALNGVNIHIGVGETLGLVGETGAGKTTLAKGIMRLIPNPPGKILGGEVIFEGQDLLKLSTNGMEAIRGRDISMIFQDPMTSLNPVLTVGEQIMEVIENHNTSLSRQEARKWAENMLERVGIPAERFGEYPHQFSGGIAPHDVGRYPLATGQVYAARRHVGQGECYPPYYLYPAGTDVWDVRYQMPVEECGNMLIMLEAGRAFGADPALAKQYRSLLDTWVQYLVKYGEDPDEQLCTDDFAGHLAHNVNLAAKAIIGVACYARLTGEESYAKQAKTMAEHLLEKIGDKGNTPLTLDGQGWSMKYNLLWDKVLGLGLMPESFYAAETASYLPRINTYGLPLDSRADYTKSDWICWTARMADDAAVRTALIAPIAKELRETTSRVPFSDWYDTKTGRYVAFIARSVQGGIFALML